MNFASKNLILLGTGIIVIGVIAYVGYSNIRTPSTQSPPSIALSDDATPIEDALPTEQVLETATPEAPRTTLHIENGFTFTAPEGWTYESPNILDLHGGKVGSVACGADLRDPLSGRRLISKTERQGDKDGVAYMFGYNVYAWMATPNNPSAVFISMDPGIGGTPACQIIFETQDSDLSLAILNAALEAFSTLN